MDRYDRTSVILVKGSDPEQWGSPSYVHKSEC
ncbi:hypothetical protein KPATCC21470_4656 [Kitasatospora purpeofusca]